MLGALIRSASTISGVLTDGGTSAAKFGFVYALLAALIAGSAINAIEKAIDLDKLVILPTWRDCRRMAAE
jgi:hypothetical protein